jgi:polyhydroxyalkanoate synthase subunit PhaE
VAMDMFEYGKALADLWTLGGKAFVSAQENTARAFAEGVKTATEAATASGALGVMPGQSKLPDFSNETAAFTRASQAVMELWSAANSLAGTIAKRLPESIARGVSGITDTPPSDPVITATFQKMLDPRAWLAGTGEMDDMLSRITEGPQFADLWDVERLYTRVFQAWMTLRRCSLEHNAVTLEGWLRAGRNYAEQLGKPDASGNDARKLLDLWIETANRVLIETQRSEPFLRTQAALIRASTALKMAQRDLAEYYGERFGFPTRTELDDVHRSVTELRRELRALQRQVQRRAVGQDGPPPVGADQSASATRSAAGTTNKQARADQARN